jgi:hypothetical protein
VKRWFPEGEEHGALEDKLLSMRGTGQAVEQSFQSESDQKHVEVFSRFDAALSQAGMD